MNRAELGLIAKILRIPPYSYCLDGGYPNERYCIAREGGGWVVYYSERGHRNDPEYFKTEDEACRRLLRLLLTFVLHWD